MSIHEISREEISMMQLSDSFFPSGMYTTSSGLEALFYSNRKITDADQLREQAAHGRRREAGGADQLRPREGSRLIHDDQQRPFQVEAAEMAGVSGRYGGGTGERHLPQGV